MYKTLISHISSYQGISKYSHSDSSKARMPGSHGKFIKDNWQNPIPRSVDRDNISLDLCPHKIEGV